MAVEAAAAAAPTLGLLAAPALWNWAWLQPWQWAWLLPCEVTGAHAAYNASAVSNSTDLEVRGAAPAGPSALALYEHLSLPLPAPSAAHLGLATGLLLALLFNARRDASKERQRAEAWVARAVTGAAWVAAAVGVLPAAGAVLLVCALYRRLVEAVLACTTGRDFAGLLAGPDAVWAVEDDAARSVVNVLATLQVEDDSVDGLQLLRQLRQLLQEKLQSGALPEKLLFLRRHSPLGYFYWQRRPQPLQLDAVVREHVRFLGDTDDLDEDATRCGARRQQVGSAGGQWCWADGLRRRLSALANAPLPQGHAAGWEVLVGGAPLAAAPAEAGHDPLTAMEEGLPEGVLDGGSRLFPVLLRVHHSLGDGVALLHLLTSALSSSQQSPPPPAEAALFQRSPAAPSPSGGRATPIIQQVPTLRAMPATRAPASGASAWPPPASLTLSTETPPPPAAPRPRSATPGPAPCPPAPAASTEDKRRDLARWLESARRSWFPPRPDTPGARRGSDASAPGSRPATPFQCFIDAEGVAVSFAAAVNSRVPTQVGSGQCLAGDASRPTSPLVAPDSPVKRPASPVPPYIPGVPASPSRRPPRRVLNGQTPLRPHSPAPAPAPAPAAGSPFAAATLLHCYAGGAAPFADDLCDASCGVGGRGGATIYYYSASDGSCRKLTRNFSHDDERAIAPDAAGRSLKSKQLARSVSFGPTEVLDSPAKKTLPQESKTEEKTSNDNNSNTETTAIVEAHHSPVKKVNLGDSPEAKVEIGSDESEHKLSLLVPAVKVEEVCLQSDDESEEAQMPAILTQQVEPYNTCLSTIAGQNNSATKEKQLQKIKLIPEGGQLRRVEAQLITANGCGSSRYAPLLQAISESGRCRSRAGRAVEAARRACALLLAPAALLLAADRRLQLPCPSGRLSGDKVLAWLSEPRLLAAARRVRRRWGARFTDVLLAALAAALDRRLGPRAPAAAAAVLPTLAVSPRLPQPPLENRFSVALLALPLAGSSRLPPACRLQEVARRSSQLRQSPDYQVNWWLIRVAAGVLPTGLLAPALRSARSSLVLSNLQGPEQRLSIAGHEVRDLVFWVPNRGCNGVGVSVLSYAGGLQLGLQLDKAVALGPDDEARLLAVVAAEIHRMDEASRDDH